MNQEFFWKLFKCSAAKEDVFTECFAETLRQDSSFAMDFITLLLSSNRTELSPSPINEIQTQVSYPGAIPDIVLVTDGGCSIFIENKMDSPEGKDQLKRYLEIPDLSALAFITRTSRKGQVSKNVLDDPKYLMPDDRDHFVWSDFHEIVQRRSSEHGVSPLVPAFLYLLRGLGQRPDKAQTRRWQDDMPEEERFRKWFLELVFNNLKDKGWRVNWDQKGREIYARGGPVGQMKRIYLNTWSNPGEFQIRIDFDDTVNTETLLNKALSAKILPQDDMNVQIYKARKHEKDRKSLDFFIAKDNLFRELEEDIEKRGRIHDYVMAIHSVYAKTIGTGV